MKAITTSAVPSTPIIGEHSIKGIDAQRSNIMEESTSATAITPANGDHTIKGNDAQRSNNMEAITSAPAIDEKSITDRYFRVGNSTPAGSGTTKLTTPTELAWMKRRMESADAKYAEITADLDKVTRILKTKLILDEDSKKMRKLEPSEKVTLKKDKRALGLNKRIAKQDYLQKKREYTAAFDNNFRVRAIVSTKALMETRLLQVIDGVLTHAMEALTTAGTNGHADEVKHLRDLAEKSKRKEFSTATAALLIELNKHVWEKTLQYKRVDSELMRLVYSEFKNKKAA